MKFENPKVPEGINVSRHSGLYELFLLSLGTLLLFAALGLAALYLGSLLGRHAPVAWENAVASVVLGERARSSDGKSNPIEAELQDLAERLAGQIGLPDGLAIKAHYLNDDMINAFATVGGHIFIARGLIERMRNENALAMVVAHEVAHIAHRDPAAALGGGLLLQILMSVATSSTTELPEDLVFGPNALLLNSFSRDVEREADAAALAALAAIDGHVGGASTCFEIVQDMPQPPELLSSHPLTQERIDVIERTAREKDWPRLGDPTPLSPALARLADPAADK